MGDETSQHVVPNENITHTHTQKKYIYVYIIARVGEQYRRIFGSRLAVLA